MEQGKRMMETKKERECEKGDSVNILNGTRKKKKRKGKEKTERKTQRECEMGDSDKG